ncbi:type II toxin-antitoxin system RelE/ParE family toxin [Leptospira venezuelensis]|uniref:type II toxin-antitoxin system RelE/ParE family toxin n=1 Tax=Leptospira venezuelensis TaxID=1958811 RepID=UPI000A3A5DB3|nr:type II toxin-antitoxin system RelE/ParE family toxin [Leptospira venezuelensis]
MNRIEFFKAENGRCLVEEFLDSQPAKVTQKITWVLKIIEEGENISKQFLKKMSGRDEIWECRIDYGSNAYRILGFWSGNHTFILTNGFQKKTQKTPIKEIERAEKYRKNYFDRLR